MSSQQYFLRVLACGLLVISSIAYADAIPPATTTSGDIEAPAEMESPTHHKPVITPGGRIGGDDPEYPGIARAAHIQGIVIINAKITKDGHLADLTIVSSPDKILSEAALKAVRTWTYKPYLMDGKPVEVDTRITVTFSKDKKKKKKLIRDDRQTGQEVGAPGLLHHGVHVGEDFVLRHGIDLAAVVVAFSMECFR